MDDKSTENILVAIYPKIKPLLPCSVTIFELLGHDDALCQVEAVGGAKNALKTSMVVSKEYQIMDGIEVDGIDVGRVIRMGPNSASSLFSKANGDK